MTPLPWREHPSAREDYLDGLAWYADQELGLGDRFADAVDGGIDLIREWPNAAPLYRGHQNIRCKSIAVFPYVIVYFVLDHKVVVVAYAHEKRQPGYWHDRLKDQ